MDAASQKLLSPVGEALSLPLVRSTLGSTSGGAAEQSEAEGVYPVEWYKPIILHRPVGVANLATRRSPVRSTLASPERGGAERT